jgi:23S rRNA (guanine745-N1)-methyltransferase
VICPLCGLPLLVEARRWFCAQGHSFDVAREGYVNLLPVHHTHSRAPGDAPEMVQARRGFLDAGHYQGLRDALLEQVSAIQPRSLLDVGCGEGYYTSALAGVAANTIGVDIARPAIQAAARRHRGITWLVASGARLPVADGAVDLVTSLFSQLHAAEMHRVLAPRGQALIVTPAPDHLWTLREGLFDTVAPHEPDKFIAVLAPHFTLKDRGDVRFDLALDQPGLRQLVAMTPYAWKAKPERRAAVEARSSLATTAAFTWLRLERAA